MFREGDALQAANAVTHTKPSAAGNQYLLCRNESPNFWYRREFMARYSPVSASLARG
jgi:hypothetical protein